MSEQESIDYMRIAKAIDYIRQNFKEQPDLDQVAESIHLSPSHFQRMFTDWAGTSPKKFLQYISLEHAKKVLREYPQTTLFDTALHTGLSSTSRLHDLFIKIEGMTPAEYKAGGRNLKIQYNFADSPFGKLILASTEKGICHIAFMENNLAGLEVLKDRFPNATLEEKQDEFQQQALVFFNQETGHLPSIKLHLKGTSFQIKVWESLLKIPSGKMATYGTIASQIGSPGASRAVGTAIGSNPVAFLIPCHRVIQASGALGGYMWGGTRKAVILGWEGVRAEKELISRENGETFNIAV
jgi:AraC family transcriptional regulator of adaptative response/methylated-DNA-[protein]-cysteine methyltransferase